MTWRVSAIPLLLTVVLALTGCGRTGVEPSPSPSPSAGALFASEEEALAAAEAAYGRYLEVSDAVGQAGWVDTAPLEAVATGAALLEVKRIGADFAERQLRQVGSTSASSYRLQTITSNTLTVYACIDVSAVDVVDAVGASVVPAGRVSISPIELGFQVGESSVLLERSDEWSGESFC